jgi:hypothetical protein
VLEVFGEHTLSAPEILAMLAVSAVLLTTYGFRATKAPIPLLPLKLFGIRTFSRVGERQLLHPPGNRRHSVPFPLLYQVGLGFTPIQSGLMLMPQAVAAMSLKPIMPKILARIGYRACWFRIPPSSGADPAIRHHRGRHARLEDCHCRRSSSDSSPRCNTPA